jgi:hypothetical protein
MPHLGLQIALTKDEAATLWDLFDVLQVCCTFRDYSDLQLLTALQKRLTATKDLPEPVVIKITHAHGKNLWDLLAAVRVTCRFSKFQGWKFIEDILKKLQVSSAFTVGRVTQNQAAVL